MIYSVGIDLHKGRHRVCCLHRRADTFPQSIRFRQLDWSSTRSQAVCRNRVQGTENDQSQVSDHEVGSLPGWTDRATVGSPACLSLLSPDGTPRQES
jgi:hypothetical protein